MLMPIANQRLVDAIKFQLRSAAGLACDNRGYVADIAANLLPGVRREDFELDLTVGGGHELEKKFRAIHSSSALSINTFAPFKLNLKALTLAGKTGFQSLQFEKRLPTGLRGTPPNLDVYLTTAVEALGIESKFLEYLTPKGASYSSSYSKEALPYCDEPWWKTLQDSKAAGSRRLDVAQLVKHYLGLVSLLNNDEARWRPISAMLLYLFWEPLNWQDIRECCLHREEIQKLAETVRDSAVHFQSISYAELWKTWEVVPSISSHVASLRRRYLITVKAG